MTRLQLTILKDERSEEEKDHKEATKLINKRNIKI